MLQPQIAGLIQGLRNANSLIKRQSIYDIKSMKKMADRKQKGKFVFEPPKAIEAQVQDFFEMIKENDWDHKIGIKGFKGTFKVEHFMMIETKLRRLFTIRELSIIDTQMDKEHLVVLRQWISWLQPQKLILEFQQNEIDDQDIEDFVYFLFERQIDLKKLFIISNPGIYKGSFLKNLKLFLKEYNQKNDVIKYHLIKNKDSKSIAIVKQNLQFADEINAQNIQQAQIKIDKTSFYSFHLESCFTETNYAGFEHLIALTYDLDNLEQLCGLDVSKNYLGTLSSFQTTCSHLSTAKGLLELHLKQQSLLDYSSIVQALVGDRYDKLRVNHLDIESNSSILEKTFIIISSELFSECKSININGCLPQQLSTLYKIGVIIDAFQKQIQLLREKSKNAGKLIKMNLEKLDLSTMENYNRHDLVEKFLSSLIFTEYCNLKELTMQNCDIGRLEAWRTTFAKFKDRITKDNNPLLKNFKLPIKTFTMPNQTYRMEPEYIKKFFLEFFFTKKGDILEIENFNLIKCFRQNGREEGLLDNVKEIFQGIEEKKEEFVNNQYTLKKLRIEDTTSDMQLNTYKCLILTRNFSLSELTIHNDGWQDKFEDYYNATISFLKNQPQDFIHSLTSLNLTKILDIKMETYKFIDLFVYNDQIRLKNLTLDGVEFECKADNQLAFEEMISQKSQNFKFSLENFFLQEIKEEKSEQAFFKYVLLAKYQEFEKLHIGTVKIESHSQLIADFLIESQKSHISYCKDLKALSLKNLAIEKKQTWETLLNYFLFNQENSLIDLKLEKIKLDDNFCFLFLEKASEILKKVIEDTQDQVKKQIDSIYLLQITNLTFIECEFDKEFLIEFFTVSKIKELKFKKCTGLNNSLKQSFQNIKKTPELDLYNNAYPQIFSMEETTLEHQVLEDFLNIIIFNLELQQIKHLSFISCEFDDKHLKILANYIHKIRSNYNYKRYYNLRSINLNGNGKISKEAWIDFFNKLMEKKKNHQHKEEEKKSQIDELSEKSENNEKNEKNENDENDAQNVIDIENQKNEDQNINEGEQQNQIAEQNIQNICDDISKQLALKDLNLKDKIISNGTIFKPNFLKNLKKINFQCGFDGSTPEQKVQLFFKIAFGFVVNPESQLKEIKLTNVELTSLMDGVSKAQQLTSILLLNRQEKTQHFISNLNKIELDVKETTPDSIKSFVSTFLCSNHIELKKLILTGFKNSGILSEILQQRQARTNYMLEELHLLQVEETLTETETFEFINSFVLGNVFPLKIIKLGEQIIFKNAQLFELTLNKNRVLLESFRGTVLEKEEQISVYQKILELLFQSNCQLKQLYITQNGIEVNKVLQNIFELISTDQTSNFNLEELQLNGKVNFNKQIVNFILRSAKTLKKLLLYELLIENKVELEQYFKENDRYFDQRCESVFEIKKLTGAAITTFIDKFFFNDKIGFWRLHLKSADILPQIQQINQINQIKSLKLDMALLYNSSTQLNEKGLTLLAQNFIYNENSQCEELILLQLHLKPPGIKALTQPCQVFREEIEKRNNKQSCVLKLKTIIFYYSLYLGDDGHEILIRDLMFFEYFNMEKIIFSVTNFNDRNCSDLTKYGKQWFQFQKDNNRPYKNHMPLKYLDIGRNEFVQDKKVWQDYVNFYLFNDSISLETFNINFMALNDVSVSYIVDEGIKFFNKKPRSYKHSVKRINFSQNNALTHVGWKNVFDNFFLHPNFELIELNMISTMLDSQIKLQTIYECFVKKAQLYPNKKIPMQLFLCYNVSLKDMICQYLQPPPEDYEGPKDLPVSIDYTSYRYGIYDGIPEEFGEKVLTVNRLLYNYDEFTDTSKLKKLEDFKFSTFHLDFIEHYLKIMNNYFKEQHIANPQIYLSLQTLNKFSSLFKYNTQRPGSPYPYMLVFQKETFKFLKTNESQIYKINLISNQFPNLETLTQQHVIEIWKQIKSKKSSIDQIQVEYYLNDDLCESMLSQGYTERDIISLVRIIPPKSIRIQGGLSLSAVKGLYSILYDTHYFQYSIVAYSFETFINTGIGYALRETAYNYQDKSKVSKWFKTQFYNIFNFFVVKAETFEFDDEIINLNKYLSKRKLFFFLIAFNNLLFWFVTLLLPYYFSHYYNGDTTQQEQTYYCLNGTSKEANNVYYGFAAFSAMIEAYLVYQFQLQIPHHMEQLTVEIQKKKKKKQLTDKNNQVAPDFFLKTQTLAEKKYRRFQRFVKFVVESRLFSMVLFLAGIVFSQLFKFDLYNDVSFILTCYYCNEKILFILTLIITSLTQGIYIFNYFYLLFVRLTQTESSAKILSTKFINDIYEIATLGRNQALSTQLDKVAPYNVSVIPNNWITRNLYPDIAGRSMSNIVKGYFLQFALEDLPQTIIQTYFAVKQAIKNGGLSAQVYFILILSVYNVFTSFYLFMSIRPSTLNQDIFDRLSKKKSDQYNEAKLQQLKEEQSQLSIYTDLYHTSKMGSPIKRDDEEQQQLLQ